VIFHGSGAASAEQGASDRPGPHYGFSGFTGFSAAPAAELCRSATRREGSLGTVKEHEMTFANLLEQMGTVHVSPCNHSGCGLIRPVGADPGHEKESGVSFGQRHSDLGAAAGRAGNTAFKGI
jgi:hypothetical protein